MCPISHGCIGGIGNLMEKSFLSTHHPSLCMVHQWMLIHSGYLCVVCAGMCSCVVSDSVCCTCRHVSVCVVLCVRVCVCVFTSVHVRV